MKTFKQFIKEDNDKKPSVIFEMEFDKSATGNQLVDLENNLIEIRKEMIKSFPYFYISMDRFSYTATVDLEIPQGHYNKDLLEKMVKDFIVVFENISKVKINNFEISSLFLYSDNLSGYYFEHNFVDILPDKEFSFHDFHKVFNGNRIVLSIRGNPKFTNVLGLLKVKSLALLQAYPISKEDEVCPWIDILRKHLTAKDILACHEELVDNGLEDYAQL